MKNLLIVIAAFLLPLISFSQGLENFDSIPSLNASQYLTRNWTGANNIAWASTETRTDQTINGKAVGIRNGKLTSAPIQNGVGSVAFKYKYLFTTGPAGVIKLSVNNIFIDSIVVEKSQTTPAVAVFNNVNVSGTFTLELAQAADSARVAIDSLTWTQYAASNNCTEPTAQPTALVLTPTSSSVAGSFTATNADVYLIVRSTSPTLGAAPTDGSAYAAGVTIGNGVVVTMATSPSFIDNGLQPGSQYYYFIFAANNAACSNGPNYNPENPLTNSATTPLPACETPVMATDLELTATNTSVSGNFVESTFANGYLILMSTSPISATPVNGTAYTVGQVLGNATIIQIGLPNNFNISGLATNTMYYFSVYSYNANCQGEPVYSTLSVNANIETLNVTTGAPAGYYDAANGLTCQPLKTALKNITNTNVNSLSYTPGLWNIFPLSDSRMNDANIQEIVWDMYSDNPNGAEPYTYIYPTNQCGSYTSEGNCFNREHSTPQSWFAQATPMVSDVHHIFPVDAKVNEIRGNNPYGKVTNATNTTQNGSKLGTGNNYGYTGTVFEPIDAYKGDFARAALYMAVRYEDQILNDNWSANGNANDVFLSATDQADPAKRRLYIYDNWYLKTLIAWHNADPVSQKEIDRNNVIFYDTVDIGNGNRVAQHNRNPFIDHPEYVSLIFECTNTTPTDILDTLQTFTGSMSNATTANLNWTISSGNMLVRFVVERGVSRTSLDSLTSVVKMGLAYNQTDNAVPTTDSIYYRLKMVYNNQSIRYSNILAIKVPTSNTDVRDTLVSFTGAMQSTTSALLNWNVSQGNMITRFVLERGVARTTLDSLANTQKNAGLSYSYTDNNLPSSDSVFYRLKVVYTDGSIVYSNVVALKISKDGGPINPPTNLPPGVHPNPAKDMINVYWGENLTRNSSVVVFDAIGKKVYSVALSDNIRYVGIPTAKLQSGVYVVKLIHNNKEYKSYKVVVEK